MDILIAGVSHGQPRNAVHLVTETKKQTKNSKYKRQFFCRAVHGPKMQTTAQTKKTTSQKNGKQYRTNIHVIGDPVINDHDSLSKSNDTQCGPPPKSRA